MKADRGSVVIRKGPDANHYASVKQSDQVPSAHYLISPAWRIRRPAGEKGLGSLKSLHYTRFARLLNLVMRRIKKPRKKSHGEWKVFGLVALVGSRSFGGFTAARIFQSSLW